MDRKTCESCGSEMYTMEKGYLCRNPNCTNTNVYNSETVDHPSHYITGNYEAIDVIEDWDLNFCLGNAIKYIARANHKGNKEDDIKKAIWYLERELGLNKK